MTYPIAGIVLTPDTHWVLQKISYVFRFSPLTPFSVQGTANMVPSLRYGVQYEVRVPDGVPPIYHSARPESQFLCVGGRVRLAELACVL